MNNKIAKTLLIIAFFIFTVLFLFIIKVTSLSKLSKEQLRNIGYYQYDVPKKISAFNLISDNQQVIDNEFFLDSWTLVYFGYSRCPSECPVTMSQIRDLFSALESDDFATNNKKVLLISIDPENDSSVIIDNYAKAFNPNFVGAVGTRPMLLSLATQLDIRVVQPRKNHNHSGSLEHLEGHMNNLIMMDKDGNYHGFFRLPNTVENLITAYKAITE